MCPQRPEDPTQRRLAGYGAGCSQRVPRARARGLAPWIPRMVAGTVHIVPLTTVRDELVAALDETLRLARQLAADARDGEVPVAELVAQASMLGRLDERRENLIGQLRREASAGGRAAPPGLPVRAVVLTALDELRWPQN